MQILTGHVSPETAYVVEGYPYGGYRTQKRYWIEYHKTHGCRVVTQTLDPKRHIWNKPKLGTYWRFGACLSLDDVGHIQTAGLSEYCTGDEAWAFKTMCGAGVPEAAQEGLRRWVAAKVAYDGARIKDSPLSVGVREAMKAFVETEVR